MHIEFVEDEQDQVCECCQEMLLSVEEFINEYNEVTEEGTFTLEYFADMLFDIFKQAKEIGKREAYENIGNISMNLTFPSDECHCYEEENLD
jgi:hypothetical protein